MENINVLKKYRGIVLRAVDICLVVFACYLVLFLKYENYNIITKEAMTNTILLNIFILQICLTVFDSYKNITSSESGKDYLIYGFVSVLACLIAIAIKLTINITMMGVKDIMLAFLLTAVMMITYRVIIRLLPITIANNKTVKENKNNVKNLLIIGAGEAGTEIVKAIKKGMKAQYNIVRHNR